MAPRIMIIGGGSYQWVPKLLIDIVNTPSLADAEIVLQDIDPAPLPEMVDFVEHVAQRRGIGITVRTTTDQRDALEGADYVVVCISTGGVRQHAPRPRDPGAATASSSRSATPSARAGSCARCATSRCSSSIARDMEAVCPDAWMLNITNPMTTLCRAVTRETTVKTVGLCHEVTGAQFTLVAAARRRLPRASTSTVAGVNHLPIITALVDRRRRDGCSDSSPTESWPTSRSPADEIDASSATRTVHERDLVTSNRVKFALFERFGVLPGAGDRHLVEFFPGFLTEESEWGKRWGVHLTTIADRELWRRPLQGEFAQAARGRPRSPTCRRARWSRR